MSSSVNQEMIDAITHIFNNEIPFNKVLGLKVHAVEQDKVQLKFDMRSELVGNFMRGMVHGGAISTAIDVTGGLAAFMGTQLHMEEATLEEKMDRFSKLGTIDLRVDYLRPGFGDYFIVTGYSLRTGKKVAVTRIELHNNKEELIAVGTGSYVIS